MPPLPLWRSVTLFTMALFVLGCSDGSRNDPIVPDEPAPIATQTIEVSPSLGRIARGQASAFALNGNRLAGPVTLDDDGKADLDIPADHVDPLMIEVEGAEDADYFDESAATTLPFPADQKIRALLPEPRDTAGISILTELAVRLAETEAGDGAIDLELVELANERIRAALAEDVEDFLAPPVIVDGSTAAGSLEDDDAGRLAARLGALAMLAEGDASPALTVLTQLAADAADGSIDGLADGVAIPGLVYTPASFAADFAAAIRDFADAFGADALKTRAASATPKAAIGRALVAGATIAATVNPDLVGDYLLTYFEATAGGPFTEGETVMVIVGDDDTLKVGDLMLADPFHYVQGDGFVFETEINWLDAATGIVYGLSNNVSGLLNDLNLGDTEQPQANGFPLFLGQLFDDGAGQGGNGESSTDPNMLVRAGFEGLPLGPIQSQGDGTGDFGWRSAADWLDLEFAVEQPEVVDTTENPLTFTPAGGTEISGGDRALKFFAQGSSSSPSSAGGRSFAEPFDDTFYFAFLIRVDAIPPGFSVSSTLALRPVGFGSDTINLGIRFNDFSARLATDIAIQQRFGPTVEVGETYLLVTRLAKADGATRFNRMDFWVNPGVDDAGAPDFTLEDSSSSQPQQIGELRLQNEGRADQSILMDEFRFAGSWEGLFELPAEQAP